MNTEHLNFWHRPQLYLDFRIFACYIWHLKTPVEYLNIVFGTEHKYIKMPEYLKLIYSVESKTKIYQMLGLLDIS